MEAYNQMSNVVVEAHIEGEFTGWDGETLFILSNGQYWLQARYSYVYHYAYRPIVKISRNNNRFYLEVEGLNDVVEVKKADNVIESQIDGEFTGWDGETVFELSNGQVWKQNRYAYKYHYSYRPRVVIYDSGSGYKLSVKGVTETLPVRRIR